MNKSTFSFIQSNIFSRVPMWYATINIETLPIDMPSLR